MSRLGGTISLVPSSLMRRSAYLRSSLLPEELESYDSLKEYFNKGTIQVPYMMWNDLLRLHTNL